LSEINPSGHRLGPISTRMFNAEQNSQLEDIHEEKNIMSFKTEDGRLGKAAIDNAKDVFRNMKSIFLSILEVTSEEFDEIIDTFEKELEDNNSYLDVIRAYG
ncbi:13690_t:CDS:2, partial [Acaulospora morrowiae]